MAEDKPQDTHRPIFPTRDVKFIACFLKHMPRFCYHRGTALENPQRLLKHKENPVRLGPRYNLSTTVFLSSGQAEAHEKMTSKIQGQKPHLDVATQHVVSRNNRGMIVSTEGK